MKQILFLIGVVFSLSAFSQEITMSKENTLSAEEVAQAEENLDLEEVAALFGKSSDLEDFEKRLNDPESNISNIDLNGDGEVDYLRVLEKVEGDTHTIYVQAAVTQDTFKNVASLVVVKESNNEVNIRVVGDPTIYGTNYVFVPTYARVPGVVGWFWGPSYAVWVSPYRYGYYPPYYRSRTVVVRSSPAVRTNVRVRTAPARRSTVIIRN